MPLPRRALDVVRAAPALLVAVALAACSGEGVVAPDHPDPERPTGPVEASAAAVEDFDCTTAQGIPASDCEALRAFYLGTGGADWTRSDNWFETTTPCGDWYGIVCVGSRVTRLQLQGNGLSGSLPAEIADLDALQRLHLSSNELTGTIPPEVGSLPALAVLGLEANALTGSIPPELGNLGSLTRLFLGFNSLTGPIPPALGQAGSLEILNAPGNQLSGPLPSALGDASSLVAIFLWDNRISGAIPPELGGLENLNSLVLSRNELTGPIPPELGNLSGLTWLGLDGNRLSGPIPPELAGLTSISLLYLHDNQLTGQLPLEVAERFTAAFCWLADNAGLFVPDEPAYQALADANGLICGLPLGGEETDTEPPVIDFALETDELWPPNHQMVRVATGIRATDDQDDAPTVAIDVVSDEPVDGEGDGATEPDWEVRPDGAGGYDLFLRAERSGNGDGRVYSITVTATDAAGNEAVATGEVRVPHDRGRKGGRGRR